MADRPERVLVPLDAELWRSYAAAKRLAELLEVVGMGEDARLVREIRSRLHARLLELVR